MENKKLISPKQIFKEAVKNKIIITVFIVAIIGICGILLITSNNKPEAVTVVKSSLTGFADISKLSVLELPFNTYTTVYEKDKNGKDDMDKPKYHVAYNGTVRLGIDFNDIKITEDAEKKIIYVEIPDVKIQNVSVDEDLNFIFAKDKYETENVVAKSIPICQEDLTKKVNGENGENMKLIAKENAIASIKAITEPLIKHLPEGYVIVYR